MNLNTLAGIIQIILTPAVMITACAITVGGFWSHVTSINDRIRAMNRERLELWRAATWDAYAIERIQEINEQTPVLVSRHHRVISVIVFMYITILMYILCMVFIAGTALFQVPATVALFLFLAGTLTLLAAIVLAIFELHSASEALEFEVERVNTISREIPVK